MSCSKSGFVQMFAAILSLTVVASSSVLAQDVAVPPGRWIIDYGETRCSLARRSGGADSPILVLGTYLGGEQPQLILMADGNERLPSDIPDRVEIILEPSGHRVRGTATPRRVRSGQTLIISELGDDFAERFGGSSRLSVEGSGRQLFASDLPIASQGLAALNACNDDLMRSWGVDPAAQAQLQRQARAVGLWITNADYPAVAIQRNAQGTSRMRVAVRPDGRVADCVIVASSGSAELDAQACALTLQRGRFDPALDASGQPTAASMIYSIRWQLPGG